LPDSKEVSAKPCIFRRLSHTSGQKFGVNPAHQRGAGPEITVLVKVATVVDEAVKSGAVMMQRVRQQSGENNYLQKQGDSVAFARMRI
jgi:hypothetical protein